MKLYLDTEFNEFGGALISLALVPEVRKYREFYEELPCPKPGAWVKEHVIPKLTKPAVSVPVFEKLLYRYLLEFSAPVTIVADYPDDISYLCKALITGPGTRIAIDDINFELRCGLTYVSAVPHHALFDARALRDSAESLENSARQKAPTY